MILYSARHTFTTRLLQAGIDLRTVGDITGHTDRELVLHYSHITPESTERATAAIEIIEGKRFGYYVEPSTQPLNTTSEAFTLLIRAIKIFDEFRKQQIFPI